MKRWFLIRHIRWLWLSYRLERWWNQVGHLLGAVRNPADLQYLDDVWRGRA